MVERVWKRDIQFMPEPSDTYVEILRRQTPSQKVAAIHTLRRTAWEMKAAWIRHCEPLLPEQEVQQRVRAIFLNAVV